MSNPKYARFTAPVEPYQPGAVADPKTKRRTRRVVLIIVGLALAGLGSCVAIEVSGNSHFGDGVAANACSEVQPYRNYLKGLATRSEATDALTKAEHSAETAVADDPKNEPLLRSIQAAETDLTGSGDGTGTYALLQNCS